MGCYRRLRTTFPSVSPVAWSSFSTGTQSRRGTTSSTSSIAIAGPTCRCCRRRASARSTRFLKLGRYRIPLGKPTLRLLRKSKPFWTILGEHRIWSTILRVPITFPPDRFYGAELSAMCVPDLLGTQGTFLLFTTRPAAGRFKEGGIRVPVALAGDRIETTDRRVRRTCFVEGEPAADAAVAACARSRDAASSAPIIGGARVDLEPGRLSDWVTLRFRAVPGIDVTGISRLLVTEMDEHFSLYMSPINIDPEKPAMPISHPSYYATYLAKRIGPYSTLGLAEDTWALNEGVIDDGTFLQQTYDIDRERESMFFAALDRLQRGQPGLRLRRDRPHSAHVLALHRSRGIRPPPAAKARSTATRSAKLYQHNDALVGASSSGCRDGDVLMVISDHGFSSFRRGVNLNSWLRREGYLDAEGRRDGTGEWLRDVDWSATSAYCLGLTGMFLNLRGRERDGIVAPGAEAAALKAEIIAKLNGLRDGDEATSGSARCSTPRQLYDGPVPRQRARPAHRLQRRLPHLVGLRDRRRRRAGLRGQRQGVERRSLHRSAARAGRVLLQSRDRQPTSRRSSTSRRRRCGCSASSRRATWTAGRSPGWYEARSRGLVLGGADRQPVRVRRRSQDDWPARHRPRLRRPRLRPDRELMASGRLPNFSRLAERGSFAAWERRFRRRVRSPGRRSSPGLDPGRHGIFDFIHRDPKTMQPYLSTTRTEAGVANAEARQWQFPLDERPSGAAARGPAVLGRRWSSTASRRRSSGCRRISRRPARRRAS